MKITKPVLVSAFMIAIASVASGCVSSQYSSDNRFNDTPAPIVEGRAHQPHTWWNTNAYDREAERKSIARDMPYSTVRPTYQ